MYVSRRRFIKTSARLTPPALISAAFPFYLPARHNRVAPSDQVNIGLIGCNNRGFHVLKNHLKVTGVNCVALCDVDQNVLQKRTAEIENDHGSKPSMYEDFRDLLEQKDIDAVIVGTPDHWHCLPMIYACELGKDVYVEKPLANSIEECNLMVKATRQYKRIVQVGQQQRSSEVWNQVMEFVKSGKLGKVQKVDIWGNFNYGLGPVKQPDAPPPAGVNYDLFLGPARLRPFNPARFHGSWRFFWDYGGGLMTDWGVHLLDMALWARDLKRPPDKVTAQGYQYSMPDRSRETQDVLTALFSYDDYLIQWEHNAGRQVGPYGRNYGVAFIGDMGTLVADRARWEVIPEWDGDLKRNKMEKVGPVEGKNGHEQHPVNFIESIKSRNEPACPIEVGRAVAVAAHMANIAVRTEAHHLEWDETRNKFTNSKSANRLIVPEYRKPWSLPKL
jgi:predicted dehydrogenase